MRRRLPARLAAVLLGTTGLGAVAVATASAGTGRSCYQSSCDGLDPTSSYNSHTGAECSTGAYTVPGGSQKAYGGLLEMRWGPDCQVNWARFTVGTTDPSFDGYTFVLSTTSSDGHTTSYSFTGDQGVTYYGNEEYSPGPAQVCVVPLTSTFPHPFPACWTQPQ